jgi:hypothetical protein
MAGGNKEKQREEREGREILFSAIFELSLVVGWFVRSFLPPALPSLSPVEAFFRAGPMCF